MLGTLDQPSQGEVQYRGKNVFSWNDKRLAQFRNEKIGFVFQLHYLLPEFSALENTMMRRYSG
jgi:lipoprotein-releasing system ATP-binding protein